jgi:hypothetical protein
MHFFFLFSEKEKKNNAIVHICKLPVSKDSLRFLIVLAFQLQFASTSLPFDRGAGGRHQNDERI